MKDLANCLIIPHAYILFFVVVVVVSLLCLAVIIVKLNLVVRIDTIDRPENKLEA